ncbi:hypothetical protein ABBQ32_012868 [Trebouxia sp. C0010 RCD-2024]
MSNQTQVEGVQQLIADVARKVSDLEASLVVAKQAEDREEVNWLRTQLEQFYKNQVALQEKENLLLRAQQGGYTNQVTGLGGRDEGVVNRMATGYFTRRTETINQVLDMLQEYGLVMMCAPPRSGKTSLCQLVTLKARASSMFQRVIYFSCAAVTTNESFQIQFRSKCGVPFDEAAQQASASNRTVIVIDEAQRSYNSAACLWGWAKHVLNSPTNPQELMILTASSHGSKPLASMGYTASPIEFDAPRSILVRRLKDDQPALQFTDSEFTEVFNSFCQRKQLQSVCMQMIKDYIGNMSERHPGLVLHMLDVLDVISNYADNPPEYVARAQDMYLGQAFISNLENVRSFMSSQAIMVVGAQHDLLEKLLFKRQVILVQLSNQEQAVANHLTRSGYLVAEPFKVDQGAFVVTFVSKLHMEYTRFCFYSRSYSTLAQMPTSMSDFLRLVLQRMSFAQMANSLNISKSPSRGLLEAHYQNEFYR